MEEQQEVSIAEILNAPSAKEVLKKIKEKAEENLNSNPRMSLTEFIAELEKLDIRENEISAEIND